MKTFKQFISEAITAPDNPNFWKWFGKSKVVDAQGNPLVVFHTSVADFTKFKRSPKDIGIHFGTHGQASDRYHLKIESDPYGPSIRGVKHNTIPVFLRIENPLRLIDVGSWTGNNIWYEIQDMPEFKGKVFSNMTASAIRTVIQSVGYDGIVYANSGETHGGEIYRRRRDEAWKKLRLDLRLYDRKQPITYTPEDKQHPSYIEYNKAREEYDNHRESNKEDSWIVFDPKQIKSAIGNNGDFSPRNTDITG